MTPPVHAPACSPAAPVCEPLRVYGAGQSWTEPPEAHHVVGANASKTKPARLIADMIARMTATSPRSTTSDLAAARQLIE